MAISGSQGFLGINLTDNVPDGGALNWANFYFVETSAAQFAVKDDVRTRRPTQGSAPLVRTPYKVGTSVQIQTGMEATGTALGEFLYAAFGEEIAPVVEASGTFTGKTKHTFLFGDSDHAFDLPYFSLARTVGDAQSGSKVSDVAVGCKVQEFGVAFTASDAVMVSVAAVGRKPSAPATQPASGDIVFDTDNVLTMVDTGSYLHLNDESGVLEFDESDITFLAAQMTLTNVLTKAERRKIGSAYPIDWTLLDRSVTLKLQIEIDDATLYNRVHYGGGTNWSRVIWTGGFDIMAASSDGNGFSVSSDKVTFNTVMVANEPRKIVEAVLTAEVIKPAAPEDALVAKLWNSKTTVYA